MNVCERSVVVAKNGIEGMSSFDLFRRISSIAAHAAFIGGSAQLDQCDGERGVIHDEKAVIGPHGLSLGCVFRLTAKRHADLLADPRATANRFCRAGQELETWQLARESWLGQAVRLPFLR
jgi:hypothetical protein